MADTVYRDDRRAYNFVCPACASPIGSKCTEPTDTGRRPVTWIHNARVLLIDGTLSED
jgi:hypothetical protein